jgi:hypothetical protein
VQLHGGAGRFGRDGRRGAAEPLHTVDVQREILTAGGHDLVVEQRVAVHVGKVRGDQVVTRECRQNADHHDSGIDLVGLPMGICKRGAQLLGEPVEYTPAEPMGSNVDFQIEHGEFCLEITARDAFEYLRIHHSRHAVGPCEIQLDLQAHEILGAVEPLLRQQPRQPRQALLELGAVALPIGQADRPRHDLLPHRSVPPRLGSPTNRPLVSRVTGDDAQAM